MPTCKTGDCTVTITSHHSQQCWRRKKWLLTMSVISSGFSMWINVLFKSYISLTYYLMVWWYHLASQSPDLSVPIYFSLQTLETICKHPTLGRSWNSTSGTKSDPSINVCCEQLWLISDHNYRNELYARENT